MTAEEPVTKFVERAKALWSDLTAIGHDMKETEVCWAVLMGLPRRFEVMKAVLMTKAEELSISGIFPQLLQAEQQLAREEEVVPLQVTFGGTKTSRQRRCYYCCKPGHVQAQCRLRKQEEGKYTVAF